MEPKQETSKIAIIDMSKVIQTKQELERRIYWSQSVIPVKRSYSGLDDKTTQRKTC